MSRQAIKHSKFPVKNEASQWEARGASSHMCTVTANVCKQTCPWAGRYGEGALLYYGVKNKNPAGICQATVGAAVEQESVGTKQQTENGNAESDAKL